MQSECLYSSDGSRKAVRDLPRETDEKANKDVKYDIYGNRLVQGFKLNKQRITFFIFSSTFNL